MRNGSAGPQEEETAGCGVEDETGATGFGVATGVGAGEASGVGTGVTLKVPASSNTPAASLK